MKKLTVLRDMNGTVRSVDIEASAEQQQDAERVPEVVQRLWSVLNYEMTTVSASALVSTLAALLTFKAGEPLKEAAIVGEMLQMRVKQYVAFRALTESSDADQQH